MREKETDPVPNFASKINLPVDPPSSISPLSGDFSERKLREREKKKTRVSSSAINPNGPFSRPLVASPSITSFPIPYPSGHTTLPFLRHRVYPRTRGFTRFEGGFKPRPRGFLARFPLHINCRRFGILCLPFFPSPALYSLCSTGGHDAGQQ